MFEEATGDKQNDVSRSIPSTRRRSSILVKAENLLRYGRVHPSERDIHPKKPYKEDKGKGPVGPKAAVEENGKGRFMGQFTW